MKNMQQENCLNVMSIEKVKINKIKTSEMAELNGNNSENSKEITELVEAPPDFAGGESSSTDNIDELSFRDRPIHEAVIPIIWLHGRWRSNAGEGTFPNITPFSYSEQLQFASVGQPGLSYSSFSWSSDKNMPMHQEAGFIRVESNSDKVALIIGTNIGLAVVEEGKYQDQSIELTSEGISRVSFSRGKPVTQTKRILTLKSDNELEQVLYMATADTPLTQHLRAVYRKVD